MWACWALALRLDRSALADLQDDFDLEALPGIRCQLLVVMAGLGARDLVRTAALDDPDATVRATACQYVVRTEPAGAAMPPSSSRSIACVADVPRVRHALLDEAQSGRLPLPDDVVLEFLTNVDLETRQLALQSLAAIHARHGGDPRRPGCPHPRRARSARCATIASRSTSASAAPPDLVRAIANGPADRVSEVVEAIRQAGIALRWVELYVARDPS